MTSLFVFFRLITLAFQFSLVFFYYGNTKHCGSLSNIESGNIVRYFTDTLCIQPEFDRFNYILDDASKVDEKCVLLNATYLMLKSCMKYF